MINYIDIGRIKTDINDVQYFDMKTQPSSGTYISIALQPHFDTGIEEISRSTKIGKYRLLKYRHTNERRWPKIRRSSVITNEW